MALGYNRTVTNGFATPEGTARLAARFPAAATVTLSQRPRWGLVIVNPCSSPAGPFANTR